MAEQLEFQKLSVVRFWERVDKSGGKDACWEWKICRHKKGGYGAWTLNKVSCKAHRLAYEYTYGPIPKGLNVCHKCDNPPCCNPSHLFIGTYKDNHQDSVKKGRNVFGERHGNSKLKESQVKEIIRRLKQKDISHGELAKQYGCSISVIGKIGRAKIWRHIPR